MKPCLLPRQSLPELQLVLLLLVVTLGVPVLFTAK